MLTTDTEPWDSANNGDSSANKARKASKGGNWWSQIEIVDGTLASKGIKTFRDQENNDTYSGTVNSNNKNDLKPSTTKAAVDNKQEDKPKQQTNQQKSLATVNNLNYQWTSIKQKQRTLATVSMQELKVLDAKLIKTYRQCQKRRLYFFGGMLYRTRDFVVRLYKDAKSERKFLETIAKQVDTTMKQLMTDNNISSADLTMEYKLNQTDENNRQQQQPFQNNTSLGDKEQDSKSDNNGDSKSINKRPMVSGGVLTSVKQQESYIYSKTSNVQNAEDSPVVVVRSSSYGAKEANNKSTKNVHISDIKMRRQLDHAQSLIDRIHRSSTELTSIVDDIIFVFRLDGNRNREKVSFEQASDSKNRRRSTFKSPIKVFMERYGNIFQAPKKQDLRLNNNSSSRVSQPLVERDCTTNGSDATSLCHLDPLDVINLPNDSAINNNSNPSIMSSSLTLNPSSYNTGSLVETGDSIVNVTSTLEEDEGFGESSTVLTLLEGINTNTTVYQLNNSLSS